MLPTQIQLQFLKECMTKEDLSIVDIDQFSEPWRMCYEIMSQVPIPTDAYHVLTQSILKMPDWKETWGTKDNVLQQISSIVDLSYPSLQELSLDLPPICWLWENWIPRGMLSLFGAIPGAGKSYISLDLARRIITKGERFPDGSFIPNSGSNVIYVDAEVVPQMLSERTKAWSMDTSKLFLMMPKKYSYLDLTTDRDQDELVTMIHYIKPELVIVDSLSSISTKGENSIEDVRAILSFLAQLAEAYQCGMLLIHHLRKRSGNMLLSTISMDDFRGSGHIIAMSRSVIGLSVIQDTPEPNKNGPRQLEIVKTNLCQFPKPLGVQIKSLKSNPKYAEIQYGSPPIPYREPNQVELCADWMLLLFKEYDQPLKPSEIISLAIDEDFSRASVYRARDMLGNKIVATGKPRDPTTKWGTPEIVSKWEEAIKSERIELSDQPPSKTDRCMIWLIDLLNEKGALEFKEIQSLAKPKGYNRNMLYKARDGLNGQVLSPKRGVWAIDKGGS